MAGMLERDVAESLVYVIDDDPLVVTNLAAALAQEAGLEVRTFTSARQVAEAWEALPRTVHEPVHGALPDAVDAVIVGLKLGDADGLDLLAALAQRDADLVGLVMTSVTDEDATARALAAVGPLRHVVKPCNLADLLPKLRMGLERRRLARALAQSRETLASRDRALAESTRQVEQTAAKLASTHTELRAATERLVQAEQLAAVGRVVTGIAHELSRQLALVGYAEAIKSRVAGDPEIIEFADIIVNAQKRLAAMVDEIRDFAAAEAAEGRSAAGLDREPADVAAVVDEALGIMRYDRDVRRRTIARDYQARPLAALHRNKFAQVVINLVSNAVLATEPDDTVTVRLSVDRGQSDPGVAVLTVSDEGAGMPPEVVARLGEPFFTTRGDRGSGLGVGICMRIVEEHGGRLTFESEPGRGTTARVTIPLIDGGAGPGERS
jgi:signal transduction histidine kinase